MNKQDLALYLSALGLLVPAAHLSPAIVIGALIWLLIRSSDNDKPP